MSDTLTSHLRNAQQILLLVESECENEPGYRMNEITFRNLSTRIANALALAEPQVPLPIWPCGRRECVACATGVGCDDCRAGAQCD